jgi:hydroxymethylglutaryl-CoA lyase
MTNRVKLIECPRDAWQGLPKVIPVEVKANYLRVLVAAGFRHIDAVSFVSEKAVPQMADSERVLEFLDAPEGTEIIGIAVNKKGAERAVATEKVTTLGFPYSVSPEFLKRNQKQTPEESLDALEAIGEVAFKAGLGVVAYISMAFGNPYEDPWSADEVIAACDMIADMGIEQISLADTVGVATPEQVADLTAAVREAMPEAVEVGAHLHARADNAAEKVAAAWSSGIRRFDMAIGGLGGCPFAQDALVGNMPTEVAIAELKRLGAELPQLAQLDTLLMATRGIEERFGAMKQ